MTIRIAFAAVLAGLVLAAQAFAATPTPEERLHAAEKFLSRCQSCFSFNIHGSAADAAALERYWRAAEDWTIANLDKQPEWSPKTINPKLEKLAEHAKLPRLYAAELGKNLWAFTVNAGEIGTVFLVAKTGGHYAVAWRIRDPAPPGLARFPVLAAWTNDAARDTCRAKAGDDDGAYNRCGPLYGSVGLLPADAMGRTRFYVDATCASFMGFTLCAQLSLWSWDGQTATPLLAKSYATLIGDAPGSDPHLNGNVLHLRQKSEFRTAYVSDPEPGRQLDWRIRITPDGVTDLGVEPIDRELDFVDQVLAEALRGKPLTAVASPRAAEKLAKFVGAVSQGKDFNKNDPMLGELIGSGVRRTKGGVEVCFQGDPLNPLVFTLEPRKGGFFVTDVVELPETSACRFPQK